MVWLFIIYSRKCMTPCWVHLPWNWIFCIGLRLLRVSEVIERYWPCITKTKAHLSYVYLFLFEYYLFYCYYLYRYLLFNRFCSVKKYRNWNRNLRIVDGKTSNWRYEIFSKNTFLFSKQITARACGFEEWTSRRALWRPLVLVEYLFIVCNNML